MSGPKVVRIVTREELLAICEGHIAALTAAIEQWERVGKRNEIVDAEDIRLAERRIVAMRDLLAKDQFVEVQKQVPIEIAFFKTDMAKRIERAAEKAAQARSEENRRLRAAASVAGSLKAKGLPVPPALLQPASYTQVELQDALRHAFKLLGPSELSNETTDRQRELAAQLDDGEKRIALADWLAAHSNPADDDPALADLSRRVEELRALSPERATALSDRLEHVFADRSPRRALLIDSLAMDIGEARLAAIAEANAVGELRAVEAQLKSLQSASVANLVSEITELLNSPPMSSEISNLTAIAKAAFEAALNKRAELDRRRVVLDGLAELGYEVKEGMQTAWVENGRVVLKSKRTPQYGVEIGGDPSKSMQLRTVGFAGQGNSRDVAADVAAEAEFCADFSALQRKIAAKGGDLSVIKALGVGATPVKRISTIEKSEASDATTTLNQATVQRSSGKPVK
ncbi:hypothetical protein [Rhizobium mongolense]|uniref:Uncharacterized protein n=2 Tax=Rhizobium mongolense TaxID=57676 RepID=A0ABR6IN52_9HYPH|nr:hypothetical protein [Rhizobium mongolense]MBB4229320.1 hypothetical protein [Rhizobium mongolense]TVZ63132.1 hypothetical protein BCL32_3253 [Rhizobium mongolense USDA 1844]